MTEREKEIEKAAESLRITASECIVRAASYKTNRYGDVEHAIKEMKRQMYMDGAKWADENPVLKVSALQVIDMMKQWPQEKFDLKMENETLRQQLEIAKEELEKIKFYAECSDIPWFVKLTKEALAQISEVGR